MATQFNLLKVEALDPILAQIEADRIAAENAASNAQSSESNVAALEGNAEGFALQAEAARDSTFFNAGRTFASVALGLAGSTDGQQFAVVEGDEIQIYTRTDAATATIVTGARYPSAFQLRGVKDAATTKFSSVADLATAKGGVYFRVHPDYCFQERSVTASTPSGIGGLVGCIKSPDGAFFGIAQQDDRRPTLRQDQAGNYYLDAATSNMLVRNASGVAYDPTIAWTHIGGWRASARTPGNTTLGGTIFAWGSGLSQGRSIEFRGVDNTGNTTRTQIALNTFAALFDSTQDPVSVPHVMRIVKSLADMAAYYNDNPSRRGLPLVPWDDSAITRNLVLFSSRPDVTTTNSFTGRFYGGLWVTGTLTDAEQQFATAEMMRLTVPRDSVRVQDPRPVLLDFDANTFSWAGETKSITDLTDNGGGSYTLNDMRWWNQEHTIIIDVESELDPASVGTFLEFISGNCDNEQVRIPVAAGGFDTRVEYKGAGQGLATPQYRVNTDVAVAKRVRIAFVVKPGERLDVYTNNQRNEDTNHRVYQSLPPSSVVINTVLTGWTLHRVALYGKVLQGDELWAEMGRGAGALGILPVHVLGDSFTAWATYDFNKRFSDLLFDEGNPILTSYDGVGGVAFYESSGNGHSQRFALTPEHWRKTIILNDGALEARGEVLIKSQLASIFEKLNHPNSLKRYIYLEPNRTSVIGSTQRTDLDARVVWVQETIGDRYVATQEAMFCAYSTDPAEIADDLADIANGIWPRTLSSGGTHYLQEGRAIYAKAAYGALIDFGWIPGTTALPGVVQNLIATGTTITWDAPVDDGNHPILGYQIQRFNGTTWQTQTAQGNAAGYTKQYIRSWVAPNAAQYRVAAITRKGIGAYTEVAVS